MTRPEVAMSEELEALLERAPVAEKSLLEVVFDWPLQDPGEAMVAERLRVFVHTWDPLRALLDQRDPAFATVNGDGDDFEVVVWVPWTTVMAGCPDGDLRWAGDVLACFAESALAVGGPLAEVLPTGSYGSLVRSGRAAPLLSAVADQPRREVRSVVAACGAWEPMGLGAILDFARAAFGPVDFDRSPVRLPAVAAARLDCPACAGRSFKFIADLSESAEQMCPEHRNAADGVISQRFAKARRSNAEAYEAIIDASARLSLRHVPEPIAVAVEVENHGWLDALSERGEALDEVLERLDALDESDLEGRRRVTDEAQATLQGRPIDPERTAILANRLLDAFEGDGDGFEEALSIDQDVDFWLGSVPMRLAQAGAAEAAMALSQRVGAFGARRGRHMRAECAKAVIEAGHRDKGVDLAEQVLTDTDDDAFAMALVGSAFAAAGLDDRAEQALRRALILAEREDDVVAAEFAWADIVEVLGRLPGRESDLRDAQAMLVQVEQRELAQRQGQTTVTRLIPKAGRNEPCPCGTGKKYKHCCGQ